MSALLWLILWWDADRTWVNARNQLQPFIGLFERVSGPSLWYSGRKLISYRFSCNLSYHIWYCDHIWCFRFAKYGYFSEGQRLLSWDFSDLYLVSLITCAVKFYNIFPQDIWIWVAWSGLKCLGVDYIYFDCLAWITSNMIIFVIHYIIWSRNYHRIFMVSFF